MINPHILEAFHLTPSNNIQPLSAGLINRSFKVTTNHTSYFLQQVNTSIFKHPEWMQENYVLIQRHLNNKGGFRLPAIVPAGTNLLYNTEGETWRCFEFLPDTYSPEKVDTVEKAYEVANCFGQFTALLHNMDVQKLHTILPNFHDLQYRYNQMMDALKHADSQTKERAKDMLQQVFENEHLLHWYNAIQNKKTAYPIHIMHHDCKISNILFNKRTDALQCPIDLDTTQPGLFFSDLGDMVRTIVPTLQEDADNVEDLHIRTNFYDATVQGYLDAMATFLTREERQDLHYAGLVLVYMQAIRFLADYLNNNIYYKVSYPEQNRDRTTNQLRLLHLLQEYTSRL
jgi:Ser/Thr protein kinase RdoA (MazF antagonist)